MEIEDLFVQIQSQLDHKLPFVIYRKATEHTLSCILQKDDILHTLQSYDNSGFVFAPFDHNRTSILLPLADSIQYTCTISDKQVQVYKKKTANKKRIDSKVKQTHIALVQSGIDQIKTSNTLKKIVLSRQEEVVLSKKKALDIFIDLVQSYKNAFVYCWYHPKIGMWLGATPETLVKINGDKLYTMALAGTQPDTQETNIQWGVKEVEEHALVKQFIQTKLSTIMSHLDVSEVYTHKAGTLLHLRADFKGVLDMSSNGIKDVIEILHPTPAVCGLPKNEAKLFIDMNEGYDRRYYTGFLGELNMSEIGIKKTNLFVNLRCMELVNEKAIVYIGGGITKDSDPEKEWEETVRKTETMKKVLQ